MINEKQLQEIINIRAKRDHIIKGYKIILKGGATNGNGDVGLLFAYCECDDEMGTFYCFPEKEILEIFKLKILKHDQELANLEYEVETDFEKIKSESKYLNAVNKGLKKSLGKIK